MLKKLVNEATEQLRYWENALVVAEKHKAGPEHISDIKYKMSLYLHVVTNLMENKIYRVIGDRVREVNITKLNNRYIVAVKKGPPIHINPNALMYIQDNKQKKLPIRKNESLISKYLAKFSKF